MTKNTQAIIDKLVDLEISLLELIQLIANLRKELENV
jgi:hypothetical protein